MTATETPAVNAHQPTKAEHALRCAAPDCGYAMHVYRFPDDKDNTQLWFDHFKRNHTAQYEPGRAPDITVEWEISALCSVCEDAIGDIEVNDSDGVRCKDCGTTWSMDGTCGDRDEDLDTVDQLIATGLAEVVL